MFCEKNVDSEYHDRQDANEEQYRLRKEQKNTTFDTVSSLSINMEGGEESDSNEMDRNSDKVLTKGLQLASCSNDNTEPTPSKK